MAAILQMAMRDRRGPYWRPSKLSRFFRARTRDRPQQKHHGGFRFAAPTDLRPTLVLAYRSSRKMRPGRKRNRADMPRSCPPGSEKKGLRALIIAHRVYPNTMRDKKPKSANPIVCLLHSWMPTQSIAARDRPACLWRPFAVWPPAPDTELSAAARRHCPSLSNQLFHP